MRKACLYMQLKSCALLHNSFDNGSNLVGSALISSNFLFECSLFNWTTFSVLFFFIKLSVFDWHLPYSAERSKSRNRPESQDKWSTEDENRMIDGWIGSDRKSLKQGFNHCCSSNINMEEKQDRPDRQNTRVEVNDCSIQKNRIKGD